MKTFFFLTLFSLSAHAYECRVMVSMGPEDKIESSFNTGSYQECQSLAESTERNNFFGLVDKEENGEVETSFLYNEAASEEERY